MRTFVFQWPHILKSLKIDMSGNNFDKFLKLNASRGGRDKIYRVIQYAMKTNNALYEKPPPNLKRMESSLSSARHVFRLTTFIESIYGLGTSGKRILWFFIKKCNNKWYEKFGFMFVTHYLRPIDYRIDWSYFYENSPHSASISLTSAVLASTWYHWCFIVASTSLKFSWLQHSNYDITIVRFGSSD